MNNQSASFSNYNDDYLNTTVVFGETKRTIISKNFKGGKVNNFFGSTELDFTYADLTGVAVLDISQACGETKIIVPRDWRVEPHVTHFCSVVDDHRRDLSQANSNEKILVIKGLSVFAVVDVMNY
jgi:predicted membrane protein